MRPRKKVKLADIAEKSGVSIVTVSNALAGRGGVSEEMRARIEACAEELGYLHSEPKQTVRKDTLYIAVLSSEERKDSLQEGDVFISCLKNAAGKQNAVLSLGYLGKRSNRHAPDIRWLSERKDIVQTDGILVYGSIPSASLRALTDFFKIPVIGYGFADPEVDIDYILDDGFRGMRRAVRHLSEQGHRDLIYISEEVGENKVLMDRLLGFWHAMYEYRLIDPLKIPGKIRCPEYGPEVLRRRILEGHLPDAVVCSSDETAAMVRDLLEEYGLRVPGDLSLTGYRSSAMKREEESQVYSSCEIPLDLHAEKCLELMRKRIVRGGCPDGTRFLDCRFINGKSSGEHKDRTVG